jgi:hypothetical protein
VTTSIGAPIHAFVYGHTTLNAPYLVHQPLTDFGRSIDQLCVKLLELRAGVGASADAGAGAEITPRFNQLSIEAALGGDLSRPGLASTGIFVREGSRAERYTMEEVLANNLLSSESRAHLIKCPTSEVHPASPFPTLFQTFGSKPDSLRAGSITGTYVTFKNGTARKDKTYVYAAAAAHIAFNVEQHGIPNTMARGDHAHVLLQNMVTCRGSGHAMKMVWNATSTSSMQYMRGAAVSSFHIHSFQPSGLQPQRK